LNLAVIVTNGVFIGVALGVFVIFIVVVDVSRYFLRGRGVTMFLCVTLCERKNRGSDDDDDDKDNDDVEAGTVQVATITTAAPNK
jgi:hypothetical protein